MKRRTITILLTLVLLSPLYGQGKEDWERFEKLYNEEKYEEALKMVSALGQEYPESNQVSHMKGRILYQQRKFKEALTEFERSIKLGEDPKWVLAWNCVYLGLLHKELGSLDQAKEYLSRAMKLKATSNSVKTAIQAWYQMTGEMPLDSESPLIGKSAPPFTLPDIFGQPLALSDFKGKVVVLQIGSTW